MKENFVINMCIPYRNMPRCREKLLHFLKECPIINNFNIIILEQFQDQQRFNLGKLINVGYDIFRKETVNDYTFMFHPIDVYPMDHMEAYLHHHYEMQKNNQDFYGFTMQPVQWDPDPIPVSSIYKACMYRISSFEKVNGYINKFWGWGFEDVDFFKRMTCADITYMNLPLFLHFFDETKDEVLSKISNQNISPDKSKQFLGDDCSTRQIHINYPTKETLFVDGLNTVSYKILHRYGVQQNVQQVVVGI